MVKKEYARILNLGERYILISSCCLLIRHHYPWMVKYLVDVVSPMCAHSMDIKRRITNAKTAFIG